MGRLGRQDQSGVVLSHQSPFFSAMLLPPSVSGPELIFMWPGKGPGAELGSCSVWPCAFWATAAPTAGIQAAQG